MTTCNAEAASVSTQQANVPRIPLIGEPAPGFTAVTTQGTVHFPEDYKGKWVILFSHPADWRPGDEVIVPPPGSCGVAQERMTKSADDTRCLDWFLCLKRLPKTSLTLPPIWVNPK